MPEPNLPQALLRALKPRTAEMLATLRRLVLAESPSLEKVPADRCCRLLAQEWRRRGTRVEILPQRHRGDHLRITWWKAAGKPAGQLLVLGHYDTVYASGTLKFMPFRVRVGKAYGPGIFDMKAGLVQALFALQILKQLKVPLAKRVVVLWTSDEEIGSDTSRKLIEQEARRSDTAFVLEPAFGPKGFLKTSRKGVGEAQLIVRGRAAHAGLAPQEGVNAIHELARQIARLERWNDPRRGVSVNADIVEGGTRTNVIAEHASTALDLRAMTLGDMRRIEKQLHALRPILPGAKIEIRGGFNRPPMERKMSAELFARAKALGRQMGLSLGECSAGGGSDGNFTAALGVPTLDGLGAIGDGAHSEREHIVISSLAPRAALLAALIAAS